MCSCESTFNITVEEATDPKSQNGIRFGLLLAHYSLHLRRGCAFPRRRLDALQRHYELTHPMLLFEIHSPTQDTETLLVVYVGVNPLYHWAQSLDPLRGLTSPWTMWIVLLTKQTIYPNHVPLQPLRIRGSLVIHVLTRDSVQINTTAQIGLSSKSKLYLKVQPTMRIFLFNRVIDEPDNRTMLLYLISHDVLYQSKINRFWSLFPKNQQGHISKTNFIDLFANVFTFLLPEFPFAGQRSFTQQKVSKHVTNNQFIYKSFLEVFLEVSSQVIENVDLRSILGFLDLLWERIINVSVIDCKDGRVEHVPFQVQVFIYHRDQIEKSCIHERQARLLPVNALYFQERIKHNESPDMNTDTQSILYSLKKQEQIIPMGYICESVVSTLVNSNFQFREGYELMSQQRISVKGVSVVAKYQDRALDTIKDSLINKQIMVMISVLRNILPFFQIRNYSANTPCYRISQHLGRQSYFQQLKTNKQNRTFFNILSKFHDRSEFDIDEIENVREKWIKKKKVTLLSDQKQVPQLKEPTNVQQESRTLALRLAEKNEPHLNVERLNTEVAFLQEKLKSTFEEEKVINLSKYLSSFETLPYDNEDPFVMDLQEYCKLIPLQLLISGRPKSGKSQIAREIAKKFDLVYVSVEFVVNKLFQRVKFFEQNPPDNDEDGNPKQTTTPLEKYLVNYLSEGKSLKQEDLLDLLNLQLKSSAALTKGFVLDLPFQNKYDWLDKILSNDLYTPKVHCRYFSHVIQLQQTQEEWNYFTKGLRQHPQTQNVTSSYQRYIVSKPKPEPVQGEQEDQQPQDEQQRLPPPPLSTLVPLQLSSSSVPNIYNLIVHLPPRNHLKVKISGKNLNEIVEILSLSLYRIPLAKKLEGNQKELLTSGLDQLKLVRRWSVWGTVDPVQLSNQKLVHGKSEFSVEYAGRVFLFQNESNQELFIAAPTKYLKRQPKLPSKFNIVINGPPKSGRSTMAAKLSELYGLKVVDIDSIVLKMIQDQKSFSEHIPSNFDARSNSIHMSEPEWKEFAKGVPLNPKDIIPVVLHSLGIRLQKKPQDWGVERTEEQLQQQQKQRQERQKEQSAKRNSKKNKRKETKDNREQKEQELKDPPLDDLSLKEIIPQLNYLNKVDQIRGYIFVGFPTSQQQLSAFKFFNIPIDKYILLTDSNQQAPNKTLKTRLSDAQLQQVGTFTTLVSGVKDTLGEDVVKEIDIGDNVETMLIKIRNFIDPFIVKVDDDAYNRTCADVQEQDHPISTGFCKDYCPVVLDEGWLIKGKDEFECGVRGRRYKCFEQKEFMQFKENPAKFMTNKYLKVPPRIMLMGVRGVGLKTQLLRLNQQTKIPILNLKDNLIMHVQNQKLKRRTEKYYNRGFRVAEAEEQSPDADLNEQAGDFDKKQSQVQIVKGIFNGIEEILINGNFYDIQEDVVQTPLVQLLTEAHRLPEVVVMLKVDEKRWMPRVFNAKDIQREHQQLTNAAREQKQREVDEARQKAADEGQQFQEPEEEQDLGVTPLQDMINERKQKLKQQRSNDQAQLAEYAQKFRELGVEVVEIDCQRDISYVFDKIMHNLKPYLSKRVERWQKVDMLKVDRHRIPSFLDNHIVKESRYGKLSPLTLRRPLKPYPLIYKSRLYYLDNQEKRDQVFEQPSLLNQRSPIPKDVIITSVVFVIGKPKTGKSELSKILAKKLGLVRISIRKIVEEFGTDHKDITIQKIISTLKSGAVLSDQMVVSLIEKRVQMRDCIERGWVTDGVPSNKTQADLLIKRGLAPFAVFSLQLPTNQIKKRVSLVTDPKYSYDKLVFAERMSQAEKDIVVLQNHFMSKYNNVQFLDAKISKWGVFEAAKNHLCDVIACRQEAARRLIAKEPIKAALLGLSFNGLLNGLSSYKNYCIVTFKAQREYFKCQLFQPKCLSLYKGKIFMTSSEKELTDFTRNPDHYMHQPKSFSPPELIFVHDMLEKYPKVENKGYCMVELSKGKLLKGFPLLTVEYKDKLYGIGKSVNAKMFLKNPSLYEMCTLQDKLPVEFEKKNELKRIAKRNDCTAFLQHHLGNILMRVLAQLGYRRLKYPTLPSKETALKFLALSLKATNPNKDQQYREKYKQKLEEFIKHCSYSQDLKNQFQRKEKAGQNWTNWDQENLLKLSEEYHQFMAQLSSSEKNVYFSKFIS